MGTSTFALADAFLRGLLVALLLALAKTLLPYRHAAAARTALALDLGLVVQTIGSMPAIEWRVAAAWQAPLVAVAVGNAVLFYLFARTLLDDRFRIGPRHAVAWLVAAGIGFVRVAWGHSLPAALFDALCVAQRLLPTGIAVTVVALALHHWKDDLVEARRSLRGYVVGVGALYSLVQVALRMHSDDGRLDTDSAIVDVSLIVLLVGGVAWRLLRAEPQELLVPPGAAAGGAAATPGAPAPQGPDPATRRDAAVDPAAVDSRVPELPRDAEDARVLEALQSAMQAQAYLEEGLSLGSLARSLGVAEYRLRRVIHQQLGFRHFGSFVNSFRLSHARAALSNPARRAQPILEIALEAGFGSIGPFNRAFRAAEGMTPTAFRQQALADS
jgi:AraC-like DNA-binding protein